MRNIETKAGKETSQDVKVAEVLHQLTCLSEIVEISSDFNNTRDVVVRVLFVC